MAKRIQLIRHDTTGANSFAGKAGEITVDLTKNELRVHDGLQVGGIAQARSDLQNVPDANSSVPGRMTAAQVTALAQVAVDLLAEVANRIAAVNAEITARIADVDAEQTRALAAEALLIPLSQKASVNGVASLDGLGRVVQAALTAISATNADTVTNGVYLTALQTLEAKTLIDPILNGNLAGTAISNDTTMAADSAVIVPTQHAARTFAADLHGKGCCVYRTANSGIVTNNPIVVLFTSELYDSQSIHSLVSFTGRLTVPTGVTKVRLTAQIEFAANGTGYRHMYIDKNASGGVYTGRANSRVEASASLQLTQFLQTPVLNVVAGDYFELVVFQNSGVTLDLICTSDNNFFSMEIIK